MTRELDLMLKERRVGLVAHYYMDAELQVRRAAGILAAEGCLGR